jgi:catechol 2,3-dioxygenase-like lactoylglutathione lyase family enzyme
MTETSPPIAQAIDHLIIGVHDLDAAARTFRDQLGFHICGGGVHPHAGTANRLIVLDNCYLELLAAQPNAEPRGFIADMLRHGHEGWVGFALATGDPDRAARALRERGCTVEGPSVGRLTTTTGHDRSWQTVRLQSEQGSGLPFLIRHDQQGEERRRLLAGAAGLAPHALGARTVDSIIIAVHALESGSGAYRDLFGLTSVGDRSGDTMLQANLLPLQLASGTRVILAAPKAPDTGPVAKALTERGEGLFAVNLTVDDLPAAVRDLRMRGVGVRVDEPDGVLVAAQLHHAHTHGARIGLVPGTPVALG